MNIMTTRPSRIDQPPITEEPFGGRRSAVSGRLLFWLSFLFTGLALLQLALVNNNLSLTTFVPLGVWLYAAAFRLTCCTDRGSGVIRCCCRLIFS